MSDGYVIIKHQIFAEISDEEVLKFLPATGGVPKYEIFDIKREIVSMENIHKFDSQEFKIYQKNLMDKTIKPYLNDHPTYQVLYFGTATIPLALHLGFCFGSWKEVDIFLFQRETMIWDWPGKNESEIGFETSFVNEEFTAPIDVIFKIEATYPTQETELTESVDGSTKVIGLKVNEPGKDVFKTQQQLKDFAYKFELGLDNIASKLPNADKIHIFPTVPVGLAFLMGTKINPNITKPIVTYQFNINQTPKYEKILVIQESVALEANITDEDYKFISEIKNELKNELKNNIGAFIKSKQEEKSKYGKELSWIQFVLNNGGYSEIENGHWKNLPDIAQTILSNSILSDQTVEASADGFYISENDEWQIGDRFIFNIKNRLKNDKSKILRALRMFIFHEAMHIKQSLTNYTAANIGRFPRVLEEADYMADVWAMFHEYAYSKMYHAGEVVNDKEFFKEVIQIANMTMWAFDDLDSNTEEMQIRRVNRYLIWYWNYLQIEDRACQTINDVVKILAIKPIIEIRGLDIRAQAQRTIFKLTNYKIQDLELGYLNNVSGRIDRASNAAGMQIDEIVKGFRERNSEKILKQLKSWYHQIRK